MPSYGFFDLLEQVTVFIRPVNRTSLPTFILFLSPASPFYVVGLGFIYHGQHPLYSSEELSGDKYLALATSHCNIDESAGIYHSLASTTLW